MARHLISRGTNERLGSTTWVTRRDKISRAPQARGHSTPQASRWRRFGRRDPREPITVRIHYRGGSEAWVEVSGRGETNRYPGWVPIADVLFDINQCR